VAARVVIALLPTLMLGAEPEVAAADTTSCGFLLTSYLRVCLSPLGQVVQAGQEHLPMTVSGVREPTAAGVHSWAWVLMVAKVHPGRPEATP
jgi:hypothetical protein